MKVRAGYLKGKTVDTIYFGGGTPSLLSDKEISDFLNEARSDFSVSENPEITLEANPDDISDETLEGWKRAGINRLSIGVQSFLQEDLDWMNRAHTAEESLSSIYKAGAKGFLLTVDLIYGLPNRTLNDWKKNLNALIELNPDHISAYCLTVEEGTALNSWVEKGKINIPEDADQAEQFRLLRRLLGESGYEQYEISNFSKPGLYSRHNTNYWKGIDYLGIGPSAHSYNGESRRWNVSSNREYIRLFREGSVYFEEEILSAKDKFNEVLMTGLRTKWGVHLNDLCSLSALTDEFKSVLKNFENQGLLTNKGEHVLLTEEGKLRADYIASELFLI